MSLLRLLSDRSFPLVPASGASFEALFLWETDSFIVFGEHFAVNLIDLIKVLVITDKLISDSLLPIRYWPWHWLEVPEQNRGSIFL